MLNIKASKYRTINVLFDKVKDNEGLLRTLENLPGRGNSHAAALIIYAQCWGYERVVDHFIEEIQHAPATDPITGQSDRFVALMANGKRKAENFRALLSQDGLDKSGAIMQKIERRYANGDALRKEIGKYIQRELHNALNEVRRDY